MTKLIKTLVNFRVIGVAVLAAGFVACGGDDGPSTGGSTPMGSVKLSPTNAAIITGAAVEVATGNNGLAALSVLGVQTSTATPRKRVLSRLTAAAAQIIAEQRSAPASVTGVTTTRFCIQGDATSGTISIDDMGATTSAKITFTDCELFDPNDLINGTMTISGLMATQSSVSGSTSINLTFTLTEFPTVTIAGSFTFSITGMAMETETTEIKGSSLTITEGTLSQGISNFIFTSSYNSTAFITTDSASFTLSSAAIDGSIIVTTLTPFETNVLNDFPHKGVMHITGAGSTSLHITVLGNETLPGDQVKIEIDADGNGSYETTVNTTWALL